MKLSIQELFFEKLDSTQLEAKRQLNNFDPDAITCLIAGEQTQGYGRYQRHWLSPAGFENLYCTFYFRLKADFPHLTALTIFLAYTLAKLLESFGFKAEIRWPNDLLIFGKKTAGILCETLIEKDHIQVFLGLGLNLNLNETEIEKIGQPATSLFLESGRKWSRQTVLKALEELFLKNLDRFLKEGLKPFHTQIETLLAYKNQRVEIFDGQNRLEGEILNLNPDGSLKFRDSKNLETKTFYSGELFLKKATKSE
ncbi:MAG: biotin--[acetyl-CoA-carboxylase] ligase [Parachlamydiales bacterium]|jgi:BirA family biotin operon repressor/biotin-[acetyl-CoA-carboxylase] ligase